MAKVNYCNECDKQFEKNEKYIKCNSCNNLYHGDCASLERSQLINILKI